MLLRSLDTLEIHLHFAAEGGAIRDREPRRLDVAEEARSRQEVDALRSRHVPFDHPRDQNSSTDDVTFDRAGGSELERAAHADASEHTPEDAEIAFCLDCPVDNDARADDRVCQMCASLGADGAA